MTTVPGRSTRLKLDLGHIRVHDVMHQGILGVESDTPISAVAELMTRRQVHAVAVAEDGGPQTVISALDVVAATRSGMDMPAGDIAATETLIVSSDERLDRAAQLMAEHDLFHLIVADPASGQAIGFVSTLDVLAAVAG